MTPVTDKKRETHEREAALVQEVKRQTGQLDAIRNVITAAANSPDLRETLGAALDAALTVVPLEASAITLIDRATGELVMQAQRGLKLDFTSTPMRLKAGEGISGEVIRTGEPVILGDPTADSRLAVRAWSQENVQAMALIPMRARGEVIGILSVMSHEPHPFTPSEIRTLRVIADQVGLAIDNARLYDTVRVQRSRLEAVLNATADAIIATDDNGIINLVNNAAETFFNLPAESMLGKPLRDAPFFPPAREMLETALHRERGGTVIELPFDDGRYYMGFASPVLTPPQVDTITPFPSDGWVIAFQDVTHLKRAEQQRATFVQTAAHEIRNPLAVTLSALQMVHKALPDEYRKEREMMALGLRGVGRIQELIDDMLDLEKIDSGVGITPTWVDVMSMIERCMIDVRPLLAQKAQTLNVEIYPDIPTYWGDEKWLTRALTNLISNAHKYTQEGSLITVRAAQISVPGKSPELALEVADNGPGIPRESLNQLFERFYRARGSEGKAKGTGLGLSIVKSVAERHGGYVYVHSETSEAKGQGSMFGMVLPYREAEASA
ncbi:MAG TPA: ATP-binding protein [Aggregatilineales bacterium]|nr:GAF domain-containing protein [Anaerolineales bacterium]HRE47718.1 ATP-binding protein [Aggregatilineales bacterium]